MTPEPPPPLTTSIPGSFARRTIEERKPRIVAQVLEVNTLGPREASGLEALREEISRGVITSPLGTSAVPLGSMLPAEWDAWERQIGLHAGRRWLDVPWYFAEAFFYLKLLAAVGHYAGPHRGRDPFAPLKDRELWDPGGGLDSARASFRHMHASGGLDELPYLLHSCLWGNRVDLSNFQVNEEERAGLLSRDSDRLLVDHTGEVADAVRSARTVGVILDNAGPELMSDILLADALLKLPPRAGVEPRRVVLHAKRSPFFVSDATGEDVLATVSALESDADHAGCAEAGRRLQSFIAAGTLVVKPHWFWNSALHFTEMVPEVAQDLASADIVLVKGDANYRRILEDRPWEPWRDLRELATCLPMAFACLRTLKSDVIVDIPALRAAELDREDPGWRINGRWGLIRFCPGRA